LIVRRRLEETIYRGELRGFGGFVVKGERERSGTVKVGTRVVAHEKVYESFS
jgi:hypothetical protein